MSERMCSKCALMSVTTSTPCTECGVYEGTECRHTKTDRQEKTK